MSTVEDEAFDRHRGGTDVDRIDAGRVGRGEEEGQFEVVGLEPVIDTGGVVDGVPEEDDLPVIVRPPIVAYTAGLALLFVLVAQWIVHRQIQKLDWLEGVNVKE